MFYAKPSGGYAISSVEGNANIKACYDYLAPEGFTKGCVAGILGNVMAESSLNPWYWQNNDADPSNPNIGYGLFQFTPASEYINASWLPDWAPNMSTSQTTPGADPNDAKAQLYAFANDSFGKWYSYCWRSYWDPSDYPALYAQVQGILSTYGSGSTLSMSQFMNISDYHDACLAFLGCYEGPLIPNYSARDNYAGQIKTILDNYSGQMDILFMKRFIIDRRHGIL